jgi:transposase
MRYVEVKSAEQQANQALHRIRSRLIRARTALANEIRGLLGEFGLIEARHGIAATRRLAQEALEDARNGLPGRMRALLGELYDELVEHDARLDRLDRMIQHQVREDPRVERLMQVEGIGPITATAIVSAVGNARQFSSARQFAAWLGLVPRQHSSGGKARLGSISKRGDTYLRTLLIHGARAVLKYCLDKMDRRSEWLQRLLCRRNKNVAAVALANKNARIVWAILSRGEAYSPG